MSKKKNTWSVPRVPYLTGSEHVTVYVNKQDRHLYRFNPDLDNEARQLILDGIRANVGMLFRFVDAGDLLPPKYSKK